MIASIPSATLLGVRGRPVLVEVHVSNGLPGFTVVGLPDAACREARDRVRAALLSSGLPWPLRRVTVNLAPSGIRKTGAGLDLPIAIGLLVAIGELESTAVAGCAFVGELGLDGTIRSVPGALPLTDALTSPAVVVPPACIPEALLVGRTVVRTARSLRELVDALSGRALWPNFVGGVVAEVGPGQLAAGRPEHEQWHRRTWRCPGAQTLRASAASGWGGSRSMSPRPAATTCFFPAHQDRARRCWPSGFRACCLRSTMLNCSRPVGSIRRPACRCRPADAGLPMPPAGERRPPFRAPHHGISAPALIGGGSSWMRPGEVSLATATHGDRHVKHLPWRPLLPDDSGRR